MANFVEKHFCKEDLSKERNLQDTAWIIHKDVIYKYFYPRGFMLIGFMIKPSTKGDLHLSAFSAMFYYASDHVA